MVVVYFWALSYFDLTQISWMNYVAGSLLIALGIWQYFNGHDHTASNHNGDHGGHHEHDSHDHDHTHDHGHNHNGGESQGWAARLLRVVPFVGQSGHSHSHDHLDETSDRGIYGMAALAFALGFTHNEEFDITHATVEVVAQQHEHTLT